MDTRLRQTVDQINANIAAIHTIVSDYNTQIANSGILFDPAEYENCTPRETQLMLQTQYQLRLKAIREAEERKSSAIPPQPTPAPEQNPEHHPSLIPPPPMPPVSQGSQPTNPAEMRRFVQSLITAFSTVAEAKRQLRNPYNISRAETFATAVNDAWQTLATTLTPEEQQ